jgi:hypothetical protein
MSLMQNSLDTRHDQVFHEFFRAEAIESIRQSRAAPAPHD